jgi:hypothetical protein
MFFQVKNTLKNNLSLEIWKINLWHCYMMPHSSYFLVARTIHSLIHKSISSWIHPSNNTSYYGVNSFRHRLRISFNLFFFLNLNFFLQINFFSVFGLFQYSDVKNNFFKIIFFKCFSSKNNRYHTTK